MVKNLELKRLRSFSDISNPFYGSSHTSSVSAPISSPLFCFVVVAFLPQQRHGSEESLLNHTMYLTKIQLGTSIAVLEAAY